MFVFWKVVEKVIFTLESIETIKDKTLLKVISVISFCVRVCVWLFISYLDF